ncbi:hypothetical protein [Streptomyces sp. NPDC060184]|uniref:hypothetical protein n=1 Tax=Streptomyces sp. NPDC060184 TaxID=3347064 RepID=UPI00365BEC48
MPDQSPGDRLQGLTTGPTRHGSRSRWARTAETLGRHPGLVASWVLLAVSAVAASKVLSQPWSAATYPVALFVALSLFSRASAREK